MALTNVWLVEEYSGSNFRINANDIIIDIGAHIGLFTLYASQYCKNGTIFCFEPVDENYDILVDNITQNNLKNVKPFKSAVSKSESTITIYRNKDEAGHSMFSFTSHALKVDSISLKKIIDENSVNQCNLIKIDCEGAEYEIIESLPLEYFKKISKLIIEYHFADSKPKLVNDLKTKLMTASFKISTVSHSSDMGLLYAIK
jgi:FkbM family methyltransferase